MSEFRRWICVALFVATLAPCAVPQAPRDLLLVNGTVYTLDEDRPIVQALSISGGRIRATGSTESILADAPAGTRVIDLHGKTVIPGLIDAHGHLINLGLSLQGLNFAGMSSYGEIVDAVAVKAESLPAGEWITGRGWDQNDWPEKSFPKHALLSSRSPYNPVALTRIDGHAMLVNARALEISGIDNATADPPGGRILRDEGGAATGVLIDRAQGLVARYVPAETEATRRAAVTLAIRECLKYGLTSVHDAGVSGADIALYKAMIDEDEFDLRVYAMIRATEATTINRFYESGPLIAYGGNRLTVRSIKVMMDGALGSRGAALLKTYTDDPGNMGLQLLATDALTAITLRALKSGFQVNTHAIGDKANHETLDAYQAALLSLSLRSRSRDLRLRIEHAQIVAIRDIPRFSALGVIPSMQATHATSDMYWVKDRIGAKRLPRAYAWKRFLQTGSRIANGSDFPVESPNPLWGFYASVTRQDREGWPEGGWRPGQRMSREEALRSFTLDAAYAAFEDDIVGSLEAGKLADAVVLSADIMKIPPAQILSSVVEMTILGGEIVYRR